ncbi:MAG: stage II sporulation protein M [Clostridia bacterium]|nr:stage II sporulation protein M [Clostridia bacterium]
MRVLSIRNAKIQGFIDFCNQRKIEYLYCIILLTGLLLGSIFSGKSTLSTFDFKIFFENFLYSRENSSFIDVFINTLTSGFIYLLLCYFSGMFALGSVSNSLILIFKGATLGVLMGYSYLSYGLKGVIFAIIIILPSAFITSITLIYSAKESFILSHYFFRLFTNNLVLKNIRLEFKKYCIKFLVFFIFILISALIDASLTKLFWNVIDL